MIRRTPFAGSCRPKTDVPTRLIIPDRFKKVLNRKEPKLQAAINRCVKLLGTNHRHPGLQIHRVQGTAGVWEAYVDRANRVTFDWVGNAIRLRNNCNHDIVTRRP